MKDTDSQIISIGDHIQASLDICHPLLIERSAPLFAVDDREKPDLYATCVAVRLESRIFLLTAAHAVYEIEKTGSAVHIGGKNIIVIPNKFIKTSVDGKDQLDVAAAEVSENFVIDNKITITDYLETTCNKDFKRPHMYCMHGYPLTKNKPFKSIDITRKAVKTYAFTYAGVTIENPEPYNSSRTTESHIALSYQLARNKEGIKVNPPKPKGMSGGGLWVVPDTFKPDKIYLSGILIEHHGKTVLVTKISQALEFVLKNA